MLSEKEKCWLPEFSPFPTVISKTLLFRIFKSQNSVVEEKGLDIEC